MPSLATFIFSLKIIIITAGVVSIAMALNFSVPLIMGFCLNDIPILWNSPQTWLKKPYLCFIINGIIITIAASSWFNNHNHNHQVNTPAASQPIPAPLPLPMITIRTTSRPSGMVAAVVVADETPAAEEEVYMDEEDESEAEVVDIKPVVVNGINQLEAGDDSYPLDDDDHDNDYCVANEDAWIVPKSDFTPSQENPLILSPFGHRIKPTKTKPSTPEGRREVTVVGRSRQKQHDTLENTWKMITEERHVPRTRQLKRSDTWQNNLRDVMVVNSVDLDLSPASRPPHALKSASFREVTSYQYHHRVPATPPDEIRKEPSLSLDELNRRAEKFIQKFNEDMRLQRQESLNKYLEMINRGAH